MTLYELWLNSSTLVPELILAVTLCVVIVLDMFTPLARSRVVCGTLALVGTAWALYALLGYPHAAIWRTPPNNPMAFQCLIVQDSLALYFKLLFLLGGGATVLFSMRSRETAGYRQGEYYALLLGAILSACLLVASNNFIMFVLALETLSMCSYVLAGFIKHERRSAEAGLKYMLYGAVASGVMLFGISYLYGMTGTLDIVDAMRFFTSRVDSIGRAVFISDFSSQIMPLLLTIVLVLVGIGFKMAMVPFQFWCPDVYQGAPTPVTAFLAVVSKAAGFGALLRVLLPLFYGTGAVVARGLNLPLLFGILAVATMTFGNLAAIRQTDVKRLLAYSSIAHAGYILMGFTVYSAESLQAMLFYFFVYLFMNLGAFWVVIVLINRLGSPELSRWRGAALKAPFLFVLMFICLISLTGIPPTAGFIGKLLLFKVVLGAGISAMQNGAMTPVATAYIALAVIGVLNSAVSLFYYMKIAKAMVFDRAEDDAPLGVDAVDGVYALLFAGPTLALFFFFTPILRLIGL